MGPPGPPARRQAGPPPPVGIPDKGKGKGKGKDQGEEDLRRRLEVVEQKLAEVIGIVRDILTLVSRRRPRDEEPEFRNMRRRLDELL
jgi:GTP-dependent phosphoenolpyruvate carboxykinase